MNVADRVYNVVLAATSGDLRAFVLRNEAAVRAAIQVAIADVEEFGPHHTQVLKRMAAEKNRDAEYMDAQRRGDLDPRVRAYLEKAGATNLAGNVALTPKQALAYAAWRDAEDRSPEEDDAYRELKAALGLAKDDGISDVWRALNAPDVPGAWPWENNGYVFAGAKIAMDGARERFGANLDRAIERARGKRR